MHQPVTEMVPERIELKEVVSNAQSQQGQWIIPHVGINVGKYFAKTGDTQIANVRIFIYDDVVVPHYKIRDEHVHKDCQRDDGNHYGDC